MPSTPDFIRMKATIEGALTSAVYLSDGYAGRFFESNGAVEKVQMDALIDRLKNALRADSIGIDGMKKTLSISTGAKICVMEIRFNNAHKQVHCFPYYLCHKHLERIEEIQAERKSGDMTEHRANTLLLRIYEDVSNCRDCFATETMQ